MAIIVKESGSRILGPGIHEVTVSSIEEVEHYSDKEKIQLMVDLESVGKIDGETRFVRFWTSPVLNPKGKLLPFAEAALGRKLTDTERKDGFDAEELLGLQLRVLVKEATSSSGKAFSKVETALPTEQGES